MGNSVWGGEEEVGTEGGPYNGGAHTDDQSSGHEEAGKLAELGGSSSEETYMEWHLVHGTPQAAIPTEVCIWRAAYSNQPCNMGYDRRPKVQALRKASQLRAYPFFVFSGFDGWAVHVATWQGLICPCRYLGEGQEEAEEGQRGPEICQLRQGRGAEYRKQSGGNWTVGYRGWLAAAIRSKGPHAVSTGNSSNQPETRYCNLVSIFQAGYSGGTDSAVGGEDRGGLRAEAEQVPESSGRLSAARMASMVPSCGGGMPGLRGAVIVEGSAGHWCHWYGETATHRTTEQGSGDGIDVAVEEDRGAVESATLVTSCVWTLYKRHTKCVAVITSRRAESWVVPGWDLITPVGALLEVVVDSAETTEEGGSTWWRDHDASTSSRCIQVMEFIKNNFLQQFQLNIYFQEKSAEN